jgi:signal transduction histidine kinase
LREQFIAVLGHDLRNPLASVDAGVRLLRSRPLDNKALQIVSLMENSTKRMAELIDNVMDFARGRLGGGISVNRVIDTKLEEALAQVTDELRVAWPDRVIESDITLNHPVACDSARIAQLLSNLIANALTHGDPAGPVRVHVRSDEDNFKLSVTNQGNPIPPETISRLFQPFSRASSQLNQQGLGLGLYIVMEIARAHDGTMEVTSSPEETRFTFRMRRHKIEELS